MQRFFMKGVLIVHRKENVAFAPYSKKGMNNERNRHFTRRGAFDTTHLQKSLDK